MSGGSIKREITINCNDLGGTSDATLILTFDSQPMDGIFKNYFPVVWKMSTFSAVGSFATTVIYENKLLFIHPQIEDDNIIGPMAWIHIDPGQQTTLVNASDPTVKTFTKPTNDGQTGMIKVTNQTDSSQNIGIGFDNGDIPPASVLLFDNVNPTNSLSVLFTPILTIYVATILENGVIRTRIVSGPIWKQNLDQLDETTKLVLQYDPATNNYSINPVDEN